jgi:hypothetical protein
MTEYGVSDLPDLRFAMVIWELTHNDRRQRRIIRDKLQVKAVTTSSLNGPAVELGLRSFSSSLEPMALRQARTAFDSGSLWQGLITNAWSCYEVADAAEADAVEKIAMDELKAGGDLGDAQTTLALLGMVNLVIRGHLLAPAGSAVDYVGGEPIRRTPIGSVVSAMAGTEWGIKTLADAVRQARLGSKTTRWVDEANGKLVRSKVPGREYSAKLRRRVQPDRSGPAPTPAAKEEQAWLKFTDGLENLAQRLEDFTDLRAEHSNNELLPWGQVESRWTSCATGSLPSSAASGWRGTSTARSASVRGRATRSALSTWWRTAGVWPATQARHTPPTPTAVRPASGSVFTSGSRPRPRNGSGTGSSRCAPTHLTMSWTTSSTSCAPGSGSR